MCTHHCSIYLQYILFFFFFPFEPLFLGNQSVQSFSHVWLFVTPWTAAWQASLSIINFQSLFKLIGIKLVMPSNHNILCHLFSSCLQTFSATGSVPMNQFLALGGQSIAASALASVLPVNLQDWFPLDLTAWISLQSKRLSRVFSNTKFKISILWQSAFVMVQLSNPYMTTGKTIPLTRQTFVGKVMSLLFNILSRFVIAFIPKRKCLSVSWLQSPSAVILEPLPK